MSTLSLLAQALVLAAGRGERMRPLTDTTPKPLLVVQGQPLLQRHLTALARAGVGRTVVNTAWLGAQIPAACGGQWQGMALGYSMEGQDFGAALETAGGIVRALPRLAEVFWVVAGDVFVPDFAFDPQALQRFAASGHLAHLWLVPNPEHNVKGDFGLSPQGLALNLPPEHPGPRYTYSTIGLYRRAFFEASWCGIPAGNPQGQAAPLAPMLRQAMDQGRVSAEVYRGAWTDVGTPERWAQLNAGYSMTPVNFFDRLTAERHSTRAFLNRHVPDNLLHSLLQQARRAPSGANLQPGGFIAVKGPARERLCHALVQAWRSGAPEAEDYGYFPRPMPMTLRKRQVAAAQALYGALGVARHDQTGRDAQFERNFRFFDAPVALIVTITPDFGAGGYMDLGMALYGLMLAAHAQGLGCCAVGALASYPQVVRQALGLDDTHHIVCGVALGYADPAAPVNQTRTERCGLEAYFRVVE